jgi:hypothetical protein
MGFNIRYLPDLNVLIERRKKYSSDDDFLCAIIGKSDSIIGSTKSMNYIDSLQEKIDMCGNDTKKRKKKSGKKK